MLLRLIAAVIVAGLSVTAIAAELPGNFRLPAGFSAELLVRVPGARSMALGDSGTLFVATNRVGNVYAVAEPFGGAPRVRTLLTGLTLPNGVAFRDGILYVADQKRLLAIPGAEKLESVVTPATVTEWPFKGFLHSWKYMRFGPDGLLYVSIGSPCNVCDESDFGVILRMRPDGTGREVYARGIRNSVGFDWHPRTGDLWFTDNGRDRMGDDVPPCELNRVSKVGEHFGFPFCHAGDIVDPEFGKLGSCDAATPPVRKLGPHVSPLGLRFYDGKQFPAEYRDQVFIAEHGSWDRSKAAGRTGYRVTLVRPGNAGEPSYEPFLEGFLDGDNVLGRPVDIMVAPDGSLLVSDDVAGVIWRISYRAKP